MKKRVPNQKVYEVGDEEYSVDQHGVIHQQPPYDIIAYDRKYVEDRYAGIPEKVAEISNLRAGLLMGTTNPHQGDAVLDVGYGSGGFMAVINQLGLKSCGVDVSGYPVPDGCYQVTEDEMLYCHWHAITFFDSVEHMIPSILSTLNTSYVMISAPWCHEQPGSEWFARWKHRRPDEHLYHFNPDSLELMMVSYGFKEIWRGNPEDSIRLPEDNRENILTSVFIRQDLAE